MTNLVIVIGLCVGYLLLVYIFYMIKYRERRAIMFYDPEIVKKYAKINQTPLYAKKKTK